MPSVLVSQNQVTLKLSLARPSTVRSNRWKFICERWNTGRHDHRLEKRTYIYMMGVPNHLSPTLEILHRSLMVFCGLERIERPKIPALPCFRVLLARIQAISAWT